MWGRAPRDGPCSVPYFSRDEDLQLWAGGCPGPTAQFPCGTDTERRSVHGAGNVTWLLDKAAIALPLLACLRWHCQCLGRPGKDSDRQKREPSGSHPGCSGMAVTSLPGFSFLHWTGGLIWGHLVLQPMNLQCSLG
jgi:hypothetical protein